MRDTIALALVRAELCRARAEAQRRAALSPRRAGAGRVLLTVMRRALGSSRFGRGGARPRSSLPG